MSFDYINALLKQPVKRTPVWIMRQAGRYLPEYRKIRQQAGDFLNLCKTPELACEITLQPLRRFDLDAAILFSDILTIPDAYGLGLYFVDGEGPKFSHPVQTTSQIKQLNTLEMDKLNYVFKTVGLIKKNLTKLPLIGFAGSPWTLATYMIEGSSSKTFSKIKGLMYDNPNATHQLLQNLTKAVTTYLNEQIKAGVDAVMIFDTWGGLLNKECYQNFSLNYMSQIVAGLTKTHNGKKIPITLFTKGGGAYLELIAASGCDAVGLDWTIELADAKKRVGNKVALQGNLDPCVLYASSAAIKQEVKKILNQFQDSSGYVFNLGHGIAPDINPDHLTVLIDVVHNSKH